MHPDTPLENFSLNEIKFLIEKNGQNIPFLVVQESLIPEADILLCRYQNQTVCFKDDVVYGLSIQTDVHTQHIVIDLLQQWHKTLQAT